MSAERDLEVAEPLIREIANLRAKLAVCVQALEKIVDIENYVLGQANPGKEIAQKALAKVKP